MTPIQRKTLTDIHQGKGYNKAHAKRLQEMGFVDFKRGKAEITQSGVEKVGEIIEKLRTEGEK